jgi:hypothetical protein
VPSLRVDVADRTINALIQTCLAPDYECEFVAFPSMYAVLILTNMKLMQSPETLAQKNNSEK